MQLVAIAANIEETFGIELPLTFVVARCPCRDEWPPAV
ncbi:MAG: hypothetical protein LAO22_18525 [Acidobacteriia bacterium]|nr:hypothetical protein [Terriglobia bacterium]